MTVQQRPRAILPQLILGGIFVFVGAFYVLTNTLGYDIDWDAAWPLALVAIGAVVIVAGVLRTREEPRA
jgi:hypothetical protein